MRSSVDVWQNDVDILNFHKIWFQEYKYLGLRKMFLELWRRPWLQKDWAITVPLETKSCTKWHILSFFWRFDYVYSMKFISNKIIWKGSSIGKCVYLIHHVKRISRKLIIARKKPNYWNKVGFRKSLSYNQFLNLCWLWKLVPHLWKTRAWSGKFLSYFTTL